MMVGGVAALGGAAKNRAMHPFWASRTWRRMPKFPSQARHATLTGGEASATSPSARQRFARPAWQGGIPNTRWSRHGRQTSPSLCSLPLFSRWRRWSFAKMGGIGKPTSVVRTSRHIPAESVLSTSVLCAVQYHMGRANAKPPLAANEMEPQGCCRSRRTHCIAKPILLLSDTSMDASQVGELTEVVV